MRRLGIVLLAILFMFMIFAGPVVQKADAVVVSTVVIGAVIAAMAAAGIGLTVSGMTSAQLSDWVSGKLNAWATDIGGSVQDHIDNNLITVTGRGILTVGTAAAQGISNFISWLKTEDSIADNTVTPILSGVPDIPVMHTTPTYNDVYNNGLALFTKTGRPATAKGIVYIPNNNITSAKVLGYQTNNPNSDPNWCICVGFTSISQISNWTLYYIDEYGSFNNAYTTTYYTSSNHLNYQFSMWYTSQLNYLIPMKIGETALFNALAGPSQTLEYDSGTITVPTIDTTDKWFLDVGAVPGSTVQTVTDGVIADTIDGSLTVSGEVAEEEPEFVVNEPIGVSGLTEIFPFCIPFDVYALLSCLSAEPQTPIFTVRFVIPGVINQEFTIDLSLFSTIAQIVRTMELIAFAIGLALVTRERFLRS